MVEVTGKKKKTKKKKKKKKKKKRSLKYIDDSHISTFLKEAAKSVYNITSKADLARFTDHSIRVGVCDVMNTKGASTFIIQV